MLLHQPGVLAVRSLCPMGLREGNPAAKSPLKVGPMGAVPPDAPRAAPVPAGTSPVLALVSGKQTSRTYLLFVLYNIFDVKRLLTFMLKVKSGKMC